MKTSILILSISFLIFWSCEEKKDDESIDSVPPSVLINSPNNNSTVNDTVVVACESIDNDEVVKVELWINSDSTGIADSTAPYALTWITNNYENGEHILFVRSYDKSGNTADSDTIILSVYNFLVFSATFGFNYVDDAGYSILQTADSGYVILGSTGDNVLLIKTDYKGIEQWNHNYGGSQIDYARHILQTSDGGYIISGTTESYGHGGSDIWLIKTDPTGFMEWDAYFGGVNTDQGRSIQQMTDGGYIIIGNSDFSGDGNQDIWLIRINSQGDSLWTKTFGGSGLELGADVQILEDGGFILLGSTESFGNGGSDIWLIKTDSEGEITWTKTFGDNSSDYGKSILKTPDDGYIIRGVTESFGYGNTTLVLIKIDSTGNKIWDNAFGGSDGEDGNALEETNDGGHILICHSYVHENSAYDIRLIKIDGSGSVDWDKTYGSLTDNYGFSVLQTFDGGYALTGSIGILGDGDINHSDIWLIKTDPEGNTIFLSE
ncbi:MAG: Ig-like domain-containing protein [Candidatus Marinimicrobia bacterium]|nr:Ig-like domain-containing protein [Candidatus Neomarinimicrobiota bacterium]